jgi:hypothetical protein
MKNKYMIFLNEIRVRKKVYEKEICWFVRKLFERRVIHLQETG